MENKLRIWSKHQSWDDAERIWDEKAKDAEASTPLKKLTSFPLMPGITKETAKHLKWKSFKWMISKDHQCKVLRGFLRHPFKYGLNYLKSLFSRKSYQRDGDFFFYGVKNDEEFCRLLESERTLLVVGFSYCHKPFECPSKRFSSDCIHDPEHPVCKQCFIGKAMHALPEKRVIPVIIPTVHHIGSKMFEVIHQNPEKEILFLITACEMTLEMFGDWGNMVGARGIGVKLDGRICNTMKAFELSEEGIKPGLTVVTEETKKRFLNIIKKMS